MRPEGRVAAGGRLALRAPFGSPLTFLGIAQNNDSNRLAVRKRAKKFGRALAGRPKPSGPDGPRPAFEGANK